MDTYHQYAGLFLEEGDRETAIFYWDRASLLIINDLSYPYGEAFHKYLEAFLGFGEGNRFQSLKLLEVPRTLSNNGNLGNSFLLSERYIFTAIEKYEDAITNLSTLIVDPNDVENAKAYLNLSEISLKLNKPSTLKLAQKHSFSKKQKPPTNCSPQSRKL